MSILDELLPLAPQADDLENFKAISAEWPAGLPDHLSPSSLKTWMRCREQWRQVYLLGKRQRPAAALIWGSAHNFALVETNFAQKITSGEDLTVDDVQLAFAESVDDRVANEDVEWDETTKPGGARNAAELKDKGVEVAAAYHRQVSSSVQPLTVEETFSIDVPGVPVPITGRMDVTEERRTIDLKTSGKKELGRDSVFQGRVYQLARPMAMEFHLATKTKVPGIYTPTDSPEFGFAFSGAEQERTRMVLALLAADILSTYERFGPDQTWPGAFAFGWACGYCGFKPTCAYWAGEQVPGGPLMEASDAVAVSGAASGFGETRSSGRKPDQSVVERECELLTRSLLTIAEAAGKNVEAVAKVVAGNRESHAGELAVHKAWLEKQLTRAEAAS